MLNLDDILKAAVVAKASDVHLTVARRPIFRIDGILVDSDFDVLYPADVESLALSIMNDYVRAQMDKYGEVDFSYSIRGVGRYRANVFRQRGSFAMVLRILPFDIPKPKDLGIPESVLDCITKKRGLVLVTGATGSGKSTTLASLIDMINSNYKKHVITLEDPIEYLHSHKKCIVNQRELSVDTQSYSAALRAALRQDPDVILVGEMRDLETISTAITAAETGHLVFSTLHTNSAASTIDRVIDVFPPHQQQQIRIQMANVLEYIVCQQLLPLKSGHGRIAAFEVMIANPAIRNLIREGKSFQIPSTIQTSKKAGMQTMDDCLYDHFMRGHISEEDLIAFSIDPLGMQKKITF